MPLNSGMYFETGSPNCSLPSSSIIMTATPMTGFVIEAMTMGEQAPADEIAQRLGVRNRAFSTSLGIAGSGTVGAPMRLDAVNELVGAAARRAGIDPPPRPHQLRHAFASNVLDAGGTMDEAQDLLGHVSISSTQVYAHPDRARLRAAVDAVPGPRDLAGAKA